MSEVKFIELTKNQYVMVDAEDFERLKDFKYQYGSHGYAHRSLAGRPVLMHREILGAAPGELTDHINGDRLDNRRSNLRKTCYTGNNRNARGSRNNPSGFKGVSKLHGRWRARIDAPGKPGLWLGSFPTAAAAARAYDAAAKKFYGEFAYLNFRG